MKGTLFIRPNLKLLVLGAILLASIQHLITSGRSQGSRLLAPLPVNAREVTRDDLRQLLAEAGQRPSSRAYTRLGLYYQQRGDYRTALRHLRKADQLAESEGDLD